MVVLEELAEETPVDESVASAFREAAAHKDEGNKHFKSGEWVAAARKYTEAIDAVGKLPLEPKPATEASSSGASGSGSAASGSDDKKAANGATANGSGGEGDEEGENEAGPERWVPSTSLNVIDDVATRAAKSLEPKQQEELAAFFANRAAAYLKMAKNDAVVRDCNAALALHPKYVKALVRRSQAYEALEKYEQAANDLKAAVEVERDIPGAYADIKRLEAKENERREKEKEEMMGKLKELGNMFLGKFGLSTDNFKFVKDPNSGSYNISFSQGVQKTS
eukprot:tig00000601_g2296.t1